MVPYLPTHGTSALNRIDYIFIVLYLCAGWWTPAMVYMPASCYLLAVHYMWGKNNHFLYTNIYIYTIFFCCYFHLNSIQFPARKFFWGASSYAYGYDIFTVLGGTRNVKCYRGSSTTLIIYMKWEMLYIEEVSPH